MTTGDKPPKLTEAERAILDREIFYLIHNGCPLASSLVATTGRHFRNVDQSLQRLRKAGCIEYVSHVQGWKTKGDSK
jgi:hypothetical protein